MSRIQSVNKEDAPAEIKEIYSDLEKNMGKVLNIFSTMGNSPAVLKGYLGINDALDQTSLSATLREEISLVVAQTNQCNYCLSAHSTIAKSLKISDDEIMNARKGQSSDAKTQAILSFVKHVVVTRARINDQDVEQLKKAGVSDKEIVEIVLAITVNMFTNYFNLITDPKIDFPVAPKIS